MTKTGLGISTLIRVLTGLFLLVACFFFAKAVMVWLYPDSAQITTPASAQGTQPVAPRSATPRLDYNFDPFHRDAGAVELEIVAASPQEEEAEETSLNVKLKGTFVPDSAIIEGTDRRQQSYMLGEEITGGVTLDSVHSGYVILLRDGNREKLSVEKTESGLATPSGASNTSTPYRGAVRGGATVNPTELLSRVSISPHKNNNRFIGYKIQAQPGFDIKPLGFKDGDVITRLGSQDLTQPGIDFNSTVISAVAEGNPTAQIMRRGRRMTIRIRMP